MASATPTRTQSGDLGGRRVLFIAYFFPPAISTGVPGSMRTVKFLRYLHNGECHVLTGPADTREQDNALAHLSLPVNGEVIHRVAPWDIFKKLLGMRQALKGLARREPASNNHSESSAQSTQTSVFKATAEDTDTRSQFQRLKDFIYDLCYFPDQAGPWIFPAARAGKKLVRDRNIDVIFATGSPWSGLITGYIISKATGKPLIVDFRDPWMDNPFHQSKGRFLDGWAGKLERKVVEHAAAVSLNTEPLRKAFLARYPEMNPERFFVMPNGYDLSDFNLEGSPAHPDTERPYVDLYHAGFLYGVRDPAPLLDAIRLLNQKVTEEGQQEKQFRFIQIGEVQLAYDIKERYKDLLESGALKLEPARPYKECLAELATADAVVNIQPFTESQVPSKLYDYLALNKPMISITPDNGALSELVRQKELGLCADPSRPDEVASVLRELRQQHGSEFTGYANRREFDVADIAVNLAEKFRTLSSAETQQ